MPVRSGPCEKLSFGAFVGVSRAGGSGIEEGSFPFKHKPPKTQLNLIALEGRMRFMASAGKNIMAMQTTKVPALSIKR